MAKAGRRPKPDDERKDGKVETRVPLPVKVRLQGLAANEGLDLSKWARKRLTDIAAARGYARLSPLDIADLNRAAVLVRAGQHDPAVMLIRAVVARHELP